MLRPGGESVGVLGEFGLEGFDWLGVFVEEDLESRWSVELLRLDANGVDAAGLTVP